MGYLIGLLFRGPFVIQLAIAAALVWGGMTVQRDEAALQAARLALQTAAPPALVDVGEFQAEAGTKLPQELNIRALLAVDQNVRLVRKKNGITTGESLLFVLMDADAGDDARVARAGIVIDPDDLDAVAAYLMGSTVDLRGMRPIIEIGGLVRRPSESGHAKTAMRDNGLTVAPGFFFIEPFVAGRAATLATTAPGNGTVPMVLFGFAAMFGLIALKKLVSGRGAARATPRDLVASRSMLDAPSPFVSPVPVARQSLPVRLTLWVLKVATFVAAILALVWWKVFNGDFGKMSDALALSELPELWSAMTGAFGSDGGQAILSILLTFVGMALFLGLMVWRVLRVFGLVGRRKPAKAAPLPVVARPGVAQTGLPATAPVAAAPASKLPAWAMVQATEASRPMPEPAPEPVAARGPAPAIVSRRKDLGPIRPGFSLRALLPARKVAMKGPDPFDRLAAQVRAEREREAMRRAAVHPAE